VPGSALGSYFRAVLVLAQKARSTNRDKPFLFLVNCDGERKRKLRLNSLSVELATGQGQKQRNAGPWRGAAGGPPDGPTVSPGG
jgi:hypothetical protein